MSEKAEESCFERVLTASTHVKDKEHVILKRSLSYLVVPPMDHSVPNADRGEDLPDLRSITSQMSR